MWHRKPKRYTVAAAMATKCWTPMRPRARVLLGLAQVGPRDVAAAKPRPRQHREATGSMGRGQLRWRRGWVTSRAAAAPRSFATLDAVVAPHWLQVTGRQLGIFLQLGASVFRYDARDRFPHLSRSRARGRRRKHYRVACWAPVLRRPCPAMGAVGDQDREYIAGWGAGRPAPLAILVPLVIALFSLTVRRHVTTSSTARQARDAPAANFAPGVNRLSSSGGVITGTAPIMMSVFGIFLLEAGPVG